MATYTVTDGQSQSFSFKPVPARFVNFSESDDINVSGAASIDASAPGYEALTVNLASNAHLTAGIHFTSQNSLTIKGDASTSVIFAGTNQFGATNSAVIQPDVMGAATLIVGNGGVLDLVRGASADISVELHSQPSSTAILVLEQPGLFKGSVNSTEGLVALRGLGTATDYDLSNGVLTIYGGPNDEVLDTLRYVGDSPQHAATSVTLAANGEVDVTETSNTSPFNGGTALAKHVAPVTPPVVVPPTTQPQPADGFGRYGNALIYDTTTQAYVQDTFSHPYSGPVAGVKFELVDITTDSLNLGPMSDSMFVKTGSGNDAIQLHGGTNVADCGAGSNFVTCADGFDTIFLDSRNIPSAASAAGPVPGAIWNTVENFQGGDAATLLGVGPGARLSWAQNEGAVGHTGLTLHATKQNGTTASLTLAGIDNGSHLQLSFGQTGGANYLYVKSV